MLAGGKRRRSRGGANGNGRKEPNRTRWRSSWIGYARGGDDNTSQGGDGKTARCIGPWGDVLPTGGFKAHGDGLIAAARPAAVRTGRRTSAVWEA